jgi:hypothetical protein
MASVVDSTSAASSSTSWNVTKPTGTTSGHLLVAQLYVDSGSYASATLPTGFDYLFGVNRGDAANGIKFKVGIKTAGGSEPSTYSFGQASGSDGVAILTAVQDWQSAFAFALDTRSNSTTEIAPSVGRFSSSDLLLCGAAQDGSGSAISWTPPAGMTEQEDTNSGGFTTATAATLAGPSDPTGAQSFTTTSGSAGAVAWSLVIADVAATVPALRQVADRGHVHDITGTTSTVVPLQEAAKATVGNYLIARIALDNAGVSGAAPSCTVSDPRSNTWTVEGPANRTAGSAANDGSTCYLAYAKITNAYSNGDSITFSHGSTSVVADAVVIEEWAGIDATTPVAVSSTTATGSSTTPSLSRTPTAAEQLFYGLLSVEGPEGDAFTQDSDTTDGVWSGLSMVSSISGTAASNQTTIGAFKRVTGTSAQTWNPTLGTSRDWAGIALVFAPANVATDLNLTDTAGGARAADPGDAPAIGIVVTDRAGESRLTGPTDGFVVGYADPTPGAVRGGGPAGSTSVGVAVTDVSGAARAAAPQDTAAVGLSLADASAGGTRAGSPAGEVAATALSLTDSAGTNRAGSPADASAIGVTRADNPGSVRSGSTTDHATLNLIYTDRPAGIRGASPQGERAISSLTALDSAGQIRLGRVGGESVSFPGDEEAFVCQDFAGTVELVSYAGGARMVGHGGTGNVLAYAGSAQVAAYDGTAETVAHSGTVELVVYGGAGTQVSYGGTATICGR